METIDENEVLEEAAAVDLLEEYRDAGKWLEMLEESEKTFQPWQEKCTNIEKQYADLERLGSDGRDREMQMFWANMEVMKPSILARPPVPVVAARFKDRKPIKRHGAEILERSLIATFEMDDIYLTMKSVRDALALNGRGTPWVVRKQRDDNQYLCFVNVDREDFRHAVARDWKEVDWVARRTYETKEDLQERFPKALDAVNQATYVANSNGSADDEKQGEEKAEVWELWHKELKLVVWVSPDTKEVLDIMEPEFNLEGFFPCPRPAYSSVMPRTLIPVPDFVFVKDQLEEINEYTARISKLSEALRMKGFYSAGNEDIGTAVEKAMQSTEDGAMLVPVPNVAALGGSGMDKAITWMPVDKVAAVVVQLVALRKQVIDDVYQITGISDIMRGSTNANETLGAQQMKSQYGSVRVKEKQEELIRISRDLSRIAGEILAENFTVEELAMLSQYDEIPREAQKMQKLQEMQANIQKMQIEFKTVVAQASQNPELMQQAEQNPKKVEQLVKQAQQKMQQAQSQFQEMQKQITFEQVVQFLSSEKIRPFVLDIETNSTIQPDENMAKQRTTEFMGMLAQALGQLAPMISAEPKTADFAGQVLKFALAPFRAGRELDAAIDELIEGMKQKAAQPEKDPQAEKAKMEAQKAKAEMDLKNKELSIDAGKAKADADLKKRELDIKEKEADEKLLRADIELEEIRAQYGGQNNEALEMVLSQVAALSEKIDAITQRNGLM
jgi:hypothetical protein